MSREVDFVVLHPDGTAVYDSFAPGQGVPAAIRVHVPDPSTQGMGRVRAWFADSFSDPELAPNPLAYEVFARLGYRHPSGWYGPVAVTMEEDSEGIIASLAPDIRATVEQLHARMRGTGTRPDKPATDPERGPAARSGSANRIRLTPHEEVAAGRDIVIGWDRGLGTFFAQVLDGPDGSDIEGEPIVRVHVGSAPDDITDPAQAIDAIRAYAQIPDNLVDELNRQRDAAGARERSPFVAWAQSAGLMQNTAPTTGDSSTFEAPEPAASPGTVEQTTPAPHQHTADTPEVRGGAGMDQLIADTATGQGSEYRAADPTDDPWLPPAPSTEYGPEL
ncbi:hypothetical protein [Nocardia carnea]|uniref:hypothetical protein n=1 Tax=Nocardia carnea TaxID=37328 RepID=UPI0024563159|nr:hypothetical protein [Nocardia carnea]